MHPILSEPVGRLSFDITNPLKFIRDIIGPDLYNKCCRIFLIIILVVFILSIGYFILTSFLGVIVAV